MYRVVGWAADWGLRTSTSMNFLTEPPSKRIDTSWWQGGGHPIPMLPALGPKKQSTMTFDNLLIVFVKYYTDLLVGASAGQRYN